MSTICDMRRVPARTREGERSKYNLSTIELPHLASIDRVGPRYWREIRPRAKMHALFTGTFHIRKQEWDMVKTASTMKPLATKAPDFSLINVDGRTVGDRKSVV